MKNILLTGASGFIGTYFINKYQTKFNINKFSFLKDDFNKLDLKGIETIIHLSALVHQMSGASYEEYEKVNLIQTLELAKKAKENGVTQFIFMSTIKVYGEETETFYDENSTCLPEDDYGITKLKAEQELLKLEDLNFKVSIIRTPIVYGHNVKANIKSLVNLVKKVPVLPLANINNKRSMVYIGNLCYLIDKLIETEINGVFLASDEKPVSTSELIKYISKALNKKIVLIKIPFFEKILKLLKPSFHKRLYGSLELQNNQTKQELNLKNPYTIDEGIEYMIKGEIF